MPSANTHVFTGLDGAISVAVESGPEGDAAKAVNDAYGLTPVGRATGVTVQVTSDMKPFHELGQRYATELRPGNVNISGSIARAHVNGALLKLMLGEGAGGTRPAGAFVSPCRNADPRRRPSPASPRRTSHVARPPSHVLLPHPRPRVCPEAVAEAAHGLDPL